MLFKGVCVVVAAATALSAATTGVAIKGKVTDGTSGIQGAVVALKNYPAVKTTSDTAGVFELRGAIETRAVAPFDVAFENGLQFGAANGSIRFTIASEASSGILSVFAENGRRLYSSELGSLTPGTHTVAMPRLATGFYLMHITIGELTTVCKLIRSGSELYVESAAASRGSHAPTGVSGVSVGTIDSVVASMNGYVNAAVPIEMYTKDSVFITLKKEAAVACADVAVPPVSALKANTKFPDPFMYIDGTRISRKADWPCLRKQLIALLGYSHGNLPETVGDVSASYSGGKLDITVKAGGKTGTFSVTIKNVPSGDGPFPAIITLGGSTIAIPAGIAEISLPQSTIANESSRTGVYSQLYGNSDAGSMLMWAWGVSRIIDGLEKTTGHKIDPKRLGVTGCSRNGKGAMVCGAFEERIALTLPMEGGSGGISSWRIAKVENGNKADHPDGCQTASEIVGESGWLAPQFNQFATGSVGLDKLPVDAHTLAAICAPRGLFMVEGSMNSWNCNVCCWTAASAAQKVYEALGVKDNIGIVMTDHPHCSGYGTSEKTAFNAFCKKFLLGDESESTAYFSNDGKFDKLIDFTKWIDWTTPTLE